MKSSLLTFFSTLLFLLATAFGSTLSAQNSTLSVQGVIRKSDGAAISDGITSLTFRLWDKATLGTAVHTETQDVQVTGGIYSTLLGTATPLSAPFDQTYFLGVTVAGGQELIPRAQLSAAPYTLAMKGQSNIVPSDGNVGIGTLSPDSNLEIKGDLNDDIHILKLTSRHGNYLFGVDWVGTTEIVGNLFVSGIKFFMIDHPLDPANKVLTHICVESPDAYNLYQGMITLDANGQAQVQLPDYYEALNKDSRYQLTCVGGWAQVYISEEVHNNSFSIAGGKPGMKVSWQVTGTRNDPWARDNKPATERVKKDGEKGTYFYPKGYGQPAEKAFGSKMKLDNRTLEQKEK